MTPRTGKSGDGPEGEDPRERELSEEELVGEQGDQLPDRTALSSLSADVAIPIDPALAADVLAGAVEDLDEDDLGGVDPGGVDPDDAES